ncbi:MAG TPA: VOC family protein [Gemmatimonadales bacterium]|nr:VOC family protein [Gemmatimonadales bacterium]
MPRPIHFEIHASDPASVQPFYQRLFGWRFQSWGGPMEYWVITTGTGPEPGIDGGLLRRRGPAPAEGQAVNAFVCTVDVPDVDATLAQLGDVGGTLAFAKMAVPGIGWLAYIKDPDGNILGIMQSDAGAK